MLGMWSRTAVRLFKVTSYSNTASSRETAGNIATPVTCEAEERCALCSTATATSAMYVAATSSLSSARWTVFSFFSLRRCKSVTSASKSYSSSTPSQTLVPPPFTCAAWKRALVAFCPVKGPPVQSPPHGIVIQAHVTPRRTAGPHVAGICTAHHRASKGQSATTKAAI